MCDYLVFLFFIVFALVHVKIFIYFNIKTYFILFYIYLLFKILNISLFILHFISLKYCFLSRGHLFKATATVVVLVTYPWELPWPWEHARGPPWARYQCHSTIGNFFIIIPNHFSFFLFHGQTKTSTKNY